jgi:uracil-DNA glycosylase
MAKRIAKDVTPLLKEIKNCRLCENFIPEPNPVLRANSQSKILIVGQAPGSKVHASGIPWNDPSGKRLRSWLGVRDEEFYDENKFAIVPMGFCYPGKGNSGDLPPRPECAPRWHEQLLKNLPNIRCTLLIGQYAQNYYLSDAHKTLTERVKCWQDLAPETYVLPHPSPRNQMWLRRNPWFENEVVPHLQATIRLVLAAEI